MAASAKPAVPRSKRGLQSRLTAKVGPLPVWAWAAVLLGAYFLYSRMATPSSSTSNSDSTPAGGDTSGDSGSQLPVSGQGSPADNLPSDLLDQLGANTSAIDALTSQLLSQPAPNDVGDGPASQPTGSGPTGIDNPPAQPPTNTGGNVAHATQTTAGVLKWGGLTFTTKTAFDSWAKAHGSSTQAELRNHPQARQIYGTLK